MKHPRDIYATLEGIWISLPYWHISADGASPIRRIKIDDTLELLSKGELKMTAKYLDAEISKRAKELANMQRIRTITRDFLNDFRNKDSADE